MNYTQYKSTADTDLSAVTAIEPPFMLSASDTRAPGFSGSCISRSTTAPADCTGDDCFVYVDE